MLKIRFSRLKAGVLLLGSLALAAPAEEKLKVGFAAGYGGVIPNSSAIVPVTVVIRNRLRNLSGRILIQRPNPTGAEVTQSVPFKSPAPSTRQFVILTRLEAGRRLRARVVFDEKIRGFQKEWGNSTAQKLVLTVGVPEAYRKKQNSKKLRFANHYQLVLPARERLPEQTLGYDGVFALMISGSQFSRLSRRQTRALRDWVATGGRLLFFNPHGSALFMDRFKVFARPQVKVFATGVYPYGAGFVASHVLSQPKEKPFWVQEEYKKEAGLFFPNLFRSSRRVSGDLFVGMTGRKGAYDLWGFLWLLLIIVAYILVIGPLDYWVVKRSGKPWLTWIIFLAAIIGFSFIAYWYSRLVHSGEMQTIYVNVLDTADGETVARGNSTFWIYSTKNTTYHIGTKKRHVLFSGRESSVASSVAWVKVTNEVESRIQARIPIFSPKTFDAAWMQPISWRVDVLKHPRGESYRLPPDLQVQAVYLASAGGLRQLHYSRSAKAWRSEGRSRPWKQVLDNPRFFMESQRRGLPTEAGLRDYLLYISFAEGRSPQPYNMGLSRGSREVALDISSRVAGNGRVLLLFLAKKHNLLPISLDVLAPDSVQVHLVRMQLPP